jgi:hypothetical protein
MAEVKRVVIVCEKASATIISTLDQVEGYTHELESWASGQKRQSFANFDIGRIAENVVYPLFSS